MPKFSIIVPVYKVEQYLCQCIDSVLCQTFVDYELILVDDGSPDNCPVICDRYANNDSRIRVIHKLNGGLSSARNAGLDIAKGEFVLLLDSDDYWSNNYCLDSLHAQLLRTNEDIIAFRFIRKYEDNTEIITRRSFDIEWLSAKSKPERLKWMVRNYSVPGSAWSMCVSRELIEKIGLRFKLGVTGEDFDWVLQLLHYAQNISCINDVFYVYRMRDGSITSESKISGIEGISYALHRWFSLDNRDSGLDRYLLQVYCVALYGFKGLPNADILKAKSILMEDALLFNKTNYGFIYYILKIGGIDIVCSLLHWAYRIRMKLLTAKVKKQ